MMALDPDDNSGPIRYAIEHSTNYRYSLPVRNSGMALHLRPRSDHQQGSRPLEWCKSTRLIN